MSQAEKELRPLLLDDGCQVLSSFELNKIASLTYGDMVCDEMFELIEKIVAQPLSYTPLTIQKALVVLRHILVYGSEKCVNSGYGIGRFIEALTSFNTVLAAQQQKGANAFFQRLQGGGVDRGGPIREAAKKVHNLLKDIKELQRIRNESASKNSLVPIGDDKVAFITDDVRHYILRKRIEQQERVEIKSNLARSEGGFGGGYMTKDGKSVVGAAHGIEEMIKMAQREKKKFSDSGLSGESPEEKILQELLAEAKREKEEGYRAPAADTEDLLGSLGEKEASQNAEEVDLLDFGSTLDSAPVPSSNSGDLLGDYGGTSTGDDWRRSTDNDLLGLAGGQSRGQDDNEGGGLLDMGSSPASSGWSSGFSGRNGLLALGASTTQNAPLPEDPFANMTIPEQTIPANSLNQSAGAGNGLGQLSGMMSTLAIGPSATASNIQPKEDRFAALDALASTNTQRQNPSPLDAKFAENRLLSGTSSSPQYPSTYNGSSFQQSPGLVPSSMPPPPPPDVDNAYSLPMGAVPSQPAVMIAPGNGQVAAAYGGNSGDDDDNPWVMGGAAGTGLEPQGAAPATPPPPPPGQ